MAAFSFGFGRNPSHRVWIVAKGIAHAVPKFLQHKILRFDDGVQVPGSIPHVLFQLRCIFQAAKPLTPDKDEIVSKVNTAKCRR